MATTNFIRAALSGAALCFATISLVVVNIAGTASAQQADAAAAPLANATLQQIGPRLSHPWGMDFLDNETVLVTERGGGLLRVDLTTGATSRISGLPDVFARRQGGLLDVMVADGYVYLCYSAVIDGASSTAIDRATLDRDRLIDRQTIFSGNNPTRSGHHFGCRLAMADGHILASLGDRGDRANGQMPSTHAGSLIRILPDGRLPADNPRLAGWAPEVFSMGHRNPQGMAVHPQTGAVWTHEHGPRGGDEINIISAGGNFGWPVVSHGREYATGMRVSKFESLPGYVDPIWVWVPSIAPSGMAFYPSGEAGRMFPTWQGQLLVGSLKFRRLYLLTLGEDGLPVSETSLLDGRIGRIRDVAVVSAGPLAGAVLLLSDETRGGLFMLTR